MVVSLMSLRSKFQLWALTLAAIGSTTSLVYAQTPCPPGSWFCSNTEIKIGPTPTPPPPPQQPIPAPPPVPAPPVVQPAPTIIYAPQPAPPPPPVVVYAAPPPPPVYAPPPLPPPPRSEFGLGLYLGGAAFGATDRAAGRGAGMFGIGINARIRPTPRFALDFSFGTFSGRDGNDNERKENIYSLLGLFYLNSGSPLQVYLLGGLGFATARVDVPDQFGSYSRQGYAYFGGLFGGGLEIRVSRRIALNFDIRGFIRTRIDDNAQTNPEFVSQDGHITNTSAGALFTGGLNIYF